MIPFPLLTLQKTGNNAVISVKHDKGIARVKYHWNDGEEVFQRGDSKLELVIPDLAIPAGKSTLYVTAIDINEKSVSTSYEYIYEGIAIDLMVVNNSDIKIVASDVTGMNYMKYKWNSEEEITVYPNEEGDFTIEQTTEIPSGLNTLYITAVNSSNITLNKKQEVKGNRRPEIQFYISGEDLYVTVRDEEGVDTVVQQINSEEPETFQGNGQKEFTYKHYIGQENILVTITATDVDGVSKTIKGKNY